MVSLDKNKLSELIKTLAGIPQLKEVRALKKRLQKEQERLFPKPVPATASAAEDVTAAANIRRSTKLQRYWRYVKLIRDNFPNLSTNKIRSQLKERQQGQEVDIPDAVWQNPSP